MKQTVQLVDYREVDISSAKVLVELKIMWIRSLKLLNELCNRSGYVSGYSSHVSRQGDNWITTEDYRREERDVIIRPMSEEELIIYDSFTCLINIADTLDTKS